jgi:hypothetical protein
MAGKLIGVGLGVGVTVGVAAGAPGDVAGAADWAKPSCAKEQSSKKVKNRVKVRMEAAS